MRESKIASLVAAVMVAWPMLLRAEEKAVPDLVKLMPASSGGVLSCELSRVITEPVTMKVVEEFLKRADVQQGLEGFAQMTGLDPRKNITRFCVSGTLGHEGPEFVAVEGTFDTDQLKGVLSQFLPQGPSPYRAHGIYQIPDEKGGPPNYLAIPTGSLLFFGKEDAVKGALDIFDGTAKAAAPSLVADLQKIDPTALVRIGVQELNKIKGDPNPIQPHLRNLVGSIVAAKDGLTVTAKAICDSADAAKEIGKICDGLLAFAHLQVDYEQKPDAKALFTAVGPATVAVNGTEVQASLSVSQATLDKLYSRIVDKKGNE